MGLNDINSLSHTRWNCKISHCVCAEVSQEGILPWKAEGDRENTAAIMRVERGKDYRSGRSPGPHSPVCGDTAKDLSIEFYGVSYSEWENRRTELYVPEPKISVPRVY